MDFLRSLFTLLHARRKQQGLAFRFVKTIENSYVLSVRRMRRFMEERPMSQ